MDCLLNEIKYIFNVSTTDIFIQKVDSNDTATKSTIPHRKYTISANSDGYLDDNTTLILSDVTK